MRIYSLYNKINILLSLQTLLFYSAIPLIAHFAVTVANETGVDLVLMQPFLLYYVNHVGVMLTSIF